VLVLAVLVLAIAGLASSIASVRVFSAIEFALTLNALVFSATEFALTLTFELAFTCTFEVSRTVFVSANVSPAVLVVRVPVVPNAIDEVYGILNVLVENAVTGLAIKSPVLEFTVNASPIVLVVSVPVEPNTSDEVYGTLTVPVLRDTPTTDNKLRAPLLALLTKFPFVPIPIYIPLSA
jgi:hypothetical protein